MGGEDRRRDAGRVTGVLAEFRARLDRGDAVSAESLIAAHPEMAEDLRRRLGAARRLERAFGRRTVSAESIEPAPPPSLAGRLLGPYRLEAALGSGGMGTVYAATVEGRAAGLARGARVAVKVVHPHLLLREGFFKRFLREAETGRRLRHTNIVRTLDADAVAVDGGHVHFLVMEHVEGQTLRALLDELGKLPEELCRHVGREAAKALTAIHAAGLVHRDIKPENLLITLEHSVKVMDLGVARIADESLGLSQSGAFVGSVLYAAPEQFRGRRARIDGRVDLYALGVTLYELATGTHPFVGDDFRDVLLRQMTETPRPAGEVNPQLSPFFEELLRTLLAKDPDQRLASSSDLLAALSEGEKSAWWHERAIRVRAATKRPLRRVRIPRETALHGREAELATLRGVFERAKAGNGQVVFVEGEAGIGKSRLVDEFVGLLQRQGEDIHFLFGSYPPGGAATASGAFSTAYREHFGEETLEDALREALPVTPLLVPAFAALLRGDAAPSGAEPMTMDSLQTVFVHATRSLATERTTIVLIDDLHFAPEEGRGLFASLALATPGHRVLLVGTARPVVPQDWLVDVERTAHVTRMPLPRLGPKDLVRLLADTLKSERLAEELAGRIGMKSDGNPFFVFEILRGLREGQFLTQRPDGTWATTQVLHDIQVPSTIQDLVRARIGDLDAEDKDVLDLASCLGFEFDAGVVAVALGAARLPVLRRLARIEARHRLVRSAGERFVFDHHQVQETLYAALPPPLAREYHAAIADAIEARSGAASKEPKEVDGGMCVDLAEHFLAGAKGARALRYFDSAVEHLEKGYLNAQAVELVDCALAVPGLLAGSDRVRALLRKVARLDLIGSSEARRAALDEAVALADGSVDTALRVQTQTALGVHYKGVSRFAEAETALRAALDHSRATGDRRAEAMVTGNLGTVFASVGRYAVARELQEQCLAIGRETDDSGVELRATVNLAVVLQHLGAFAESQELAERSLALARETGDRRGESKAMANVANALWAVGRLADARVYHERSLTLARKIGDRTAEAQATGNLGLVLLSLGRFAEAREHFERHLVLARETGHTEGEAIALVNLGPTHSRLGDAALARRHLEESLELCRQTGSRYVEGFALSGLAEVADEQADAATALVFAEESLALRREIGHGDGVANSLLQVAELRRRGGETELARSALEESLRLSREQGRAAQAARALAMLACLPGGDAAAAVDALAAAGPDADKDGVRWLLWQATGDRVHLAEAKRCLEFLVEHAPPECREPMLRNVRLHREIAAAAREHLPG